MKTLRAACHSVIETCTECSLCVKPCVFLQRYGIPKSIARSILAGDGSVPLEAAFSCSLCGLCDSLCSFGSSPRSLFLAMRRAALVQAGPDAPLSHPLLSPHRPLLAYEARGMSDRLSLFAIPPDCRTVFFPGCALPGTNPRAVLVAFSRLAAERRNLGVVLHCCSKPSHDLGRMDVFHRTFSGLMGRLASAGVERIITACPNCHLVFSTHAPGFEVVSILQELARIGVPPLEETIVRRPLVLHDPCTTRFFPAVHQAAREVATQLGLDWSEPGWPARETVCCGEGGSVGRVDKDLAGAWTDRIVASADGRAILTYCAGCRAFLGRRTRTHHLLDLVFGLAPRSPLPPFLARHLARLRLKKRVMQRFPAIFGAAGRT